MKMALVDPAGTVVGLLPFDVAATFTPPPGHTLRVASNAAVGDTWVTPTYITSGVDANNRALLLAKGKAYLALPAPTADQNAKVIRAMVMLVVDQLGDLSGT